MLISECKCLILSTMLPAIRRDMLFTSFIAIAMGRKKAEVYLERSRMVSGDQ